MAEQLKQFGFGFTTDEASSATATTLNGQTLPPGVIHVAPPATSENRLLSPLAERAVDAAYRFAEESRGKEESDLLGVVE